MTRPTVPPERTVVRDLSDALAQAFEPRTTTLQVNLDATDVLTAACVDALVAPEAAWIATCAGASHRHASDDSPVPVELVHYRAR